MAKPAKCVAPTSSSGINRDDWLQAFGDAAMPNDPDALTVLELAAMFGIHRQMAARRINELLKAGKAISTFKQTMNASGYTRRVAAYKLIDPPKKAKR